VFRKVVSEQYCTQGICKAKSGPNSSQRAKRTNLRGPQELDRGQCFLPRMTKMEGGLCSRVG